MPTDQIWKPPPYIYGTPTHVFHSCQCSQLAGSAHMDFLANKLASHIAVRTMHSVALMRGVTNSIHLHILAVAAAKICRIIPVLPACKNPCHASWHWPCPDQRCYPGPATMPTPDVAQIQQRPRLPSHVVLLLAGLLHVAVGAQLRDVVTRAQEQRQPLVQRLRPDVQDAPRPVAALDHPSSCPGPPQ